MKKLFLFLLTFTLMVGVANATSTVKKDTIYVSVPAIVKIKTDSIFRVRTFTKGDLKVKHEVIDSKIYIKPDKYDFKLTDTVYICINTPREVLVKPGRGYEIAKLK